MTNQNIYRLSTSAAAAALLIAFTAAPSHGQTARRGYRRATTTTTVAAATDSSAPWRQFKLNPATRVKLDFRNATVDAVLRVLSQASGIPIVKDPSLTGTLTLESPRQQTLSDAFSLLSVSLSLRNYEIDKQDNFLVVRQKAAAPAAPAFPSGFNPAAFAGAGGGGGSRNQPDLVVYPIKYASATELATVINDVFAPAASTTNNNNPFAAAIAAATQNNGSNGGGGGGGRGFGRRGGLGGANSTENVKASADDYSNSLIVNAPDDVQDQVADLIQQIDKQTDQPQQVKVYKLVYANATDLQPTIQSILSASTPVGRSSTVANTNNRNQQNQGRNRGFGGFFGFGGGNNNNSSSTTNGTVAADERTNSLVVTASTTNIEQIDNIIQTLDRPANYESTTFVYVMKYGRADVVANLLNQSFGNRTTGGAVGGALSTTGLAQTTLGSTTSSGTTAGGLSSNNTRNTASNFQVTSSNGTENSTTTETTGFNAAGQVVNIRNLAGQVLLVPNIDTNSIIVSAPPEDRQLVETLLQQLDQVPRQVMIETLVVEATLTKNEELGVDLGAITKVNPFNIPGSIVGSSPLGAAFLPATPATATTPASVDDATGLPQGAQATLTGRGYSAVLRAIQQDQKFNVLSTPRIFATNNATAEINVSESIPYISTTEETTAGFPINSYSFLDVGLILTVTPRILSNGKVIMDVTQTDNSLVGFNTADIPITNQREAETTVSVLDGNTVVLGGIIQNSETKTVNKVPLLGDIPVFGNLFRSSNASKTRTELLVFLTPHVISTDSDATDLRKNTEQELGASTQQLIPKTGPTDAGASNQK